MKNKQMLPPKGAVAFFSPTSDDAFKRTHPVGYRFLVALGLVALLGPMALWTALLVIGRLPAVGAWPLLGAFGAFLFGIGLFNYVAMVSFSWRAYSRYWASTSSADWYCT